MWTEKGTDMDKLRFESRKPLNRLQHTVCLNVCLDDKERKKMGMGSHNKINQSINSLKIIKQSKVIFKKQCKDGKYNRAGSYMLL